MNWKSTNRVILLICTVIVNQFLFAGLLDLYHKGTVKLIASPGFGEKTDWDSVFYDVNKRFTIAPDGSIFVSNVQAHNVYKFTPTGELAGTFGRKGEGPGDLYHPSDISILDDRYLLIGEYGLKRCMSIFDFSGKFVKKIKCKYPAYHPVALKDDRIAYLTLQDETGADRQPVSRHMVILKNISSGVEHTLDTIKIEDKSRIKVGKNMMMSFSNQVGEIMLARTGKGNLLVGASNTPEITIYSPDGKVIRTFRIQISPIKVRREYIDRFKKVCINEMKGGKHNRRLHNALIKKVEQADFSKMFANHLPYYRTITVDEEGNILVFKWSGCVENCQKRFQVYSSEGEYICETVIDEGHFQFKLGNNSNHIIFTSKGIYGLFELKNSDEISLRIVKVPVR